LIIINNMFAVTHRKIFYTFSAILIGASLALVFVFGLKPSIDFTGGSLLEVSYPTGRPNQSEIEAALAGFNLGNVVVRQTGDAGVLVKMPTIDSQTKDEVEMALSLDGQLEVFEERFNTVGPTLGKELVTKSAVALLMVILAIVLYVAYVFRHVTRPVSSWRYGFVAIIALAHDIVITLGTFALLGFLLGTEVDTLFVTALLVILGYSVNDSIVVLDRVRENLAQQPEKERGHQFEETVGRSVQETLGRSLNTALTTVLALVALVIFGGEATRDFAIALIVGIVAGTYSSICIASPLLVSFFEKQKHALKK